MSEQGPTPGPWEYQTDGSGQRYQIWNYEHYPVATIVADGERGQKDAQFIAAAPETLDALDILVSAIEGAGPDLDLVGALEEEHGYAKAILAKANPSRWAS